MWRRPSIQTLLIAAMLSGFVITPAGAFLWSSPPDDLDPLIQTDAWAPRLATTPDGGVWAVWMGYDATEFDEEVMFSRWNGEGWDAPGRVNPANQTPDRFPEIAVAADGSVRCLWVAPIPPAWEYAGLTSRWTGAGWTWPDTVWTGGGRYDIYRLASVSESDSWVVRDGIVGSSRDVFIYHWVAGNVVSEFHYQEPDSNESHPSVAIDPSGMPWVAWSQAYFADVTESHLQVTRFNGVSWEPPAWIAEPRGIESPYIQIGPDDVPWIVCLAIDPANSYQEPAAWAVRWGGQDWGSPQRISDPITSIDSTQYQLSMSRNSGELARAVWVRRNKLNVTRADIMTSAWTGATWTPAQVAGDLADSGYVEYPDVAVLGDSVWVAYMRQDLPSPAWHVWVTHSIENTTATESADFEVSAGPEAVSLRWSLLLDRGRVGAVRILRAVGTYPASVSAPPVNSTLVYEQSGEIDQVGATSDLSGDSPAGDYSYWLEVRFLSGEALSVGPRTVRLQASPTRVSISAAPNPATGTVWIKGRIGFSGASSIRISDLQGRLVRTLRLGSSNLGSGGAFAVIWDGRTESGNVAASGVYFAQLTGVGPVSARRLRIVLIR